MANETNFFSDKILIWKEASKGVTPATIAKAYSTTVLNFSLAETQKKETNPTLGNGGQAPQTDYGSSDFAGNLELKYTAGLIPIILTHALGAAVKTDATADVWTIATAYSVGDLVNHSDGIHTLVVKSVLGTGTSDGATEPNIAALSDGDTIVDNPGINQIVWVVRDKLYQYNGELKPCLETFGIESHAKTGCEVVPVTFKERFNGLFINSFEISKSDGVIIYKYSLPVIGINRTDSQKTDFAELTITEEKALVDNAFGFDDLKVEVAGSEPKDARSFRLTVNRNTTLEDAIEINQKVDNTPIPTVDGEIMLKFTLEEYTAIYENPTKEVKFTFSKANGDKCILTFPQVEFQRSPLTYNVNEPVYLTIPLNATGDSSTSTVTWSAVSTTDY